MHKVKYHFPRITIHKKTLLVFFNLIFRNLIFAYKMNYKNKLV